MLATARPVLELCALLRPFRCEAAAAAEITGAAQPKVPVHDDGQNAGAYSWHAVRMSAQAVRRQALGEICVPSLGGLP